MSDSSMVVFAGNASTQLAQDIASHLKLALGKAHVGQFSDGEIMVEIMENVRGREVFLIQPTCPPVNENLMELLIMADACQRAFVIAGEHIGHAPYREAEDQQAQKDFCDPAGGAAAEGV